MDKLLRMLFIVFVKGKYGNTHIKNELENENGNALENGLLNQYKNTGLTASTTQVYFSVINHTIVLT